MDFEYPVINWSGKVREVILGNNTPEKNSVTVGG